MSFVVNASVSLDAVLTHDLPPALHFNEQKLLQRGRIAHGEIHAELLRELLRKSVWLLFSTSSLNFVQHGLRVQPALYAPPAALKARITLFRQFCHVRHGLRALVSVTATALIVPPHVSQ